MNDPTIPATLLTKGTYAFLMEALWIWMAPRITRTSGVGGSRCETMETWTLLPLINRRIRRGEQVGSFYPFTAYYFANLKPVKPDHPLYRCFADLLLPCWHSSRIPVPKRVMNEFLQQLRAYRLEVFREGEADELV